MRIRLNDLTTGPHSIKPDRRLFIGGSDARIIMSPDEAALVRLWKEKRGEAEPEDLSGNLVVQLGAATGALNWAWRRAFRAIPPLSSPPTGANALRFRGENRCRRFGEHFRSLPENPGFPRSGQPRCC
jgi:hypothetical protein